MKDENNLTETQKKYLLVINELTCIHGHAHISSIAQNLSVSMPTVIGAMKALKEKDMITYHKRQYIMLSPQAEKLANELETCCKIISVFISEVLNYTSTDSAEIAKKLLHCVDGNFCQRLNNYNNNH